MGRPPRTFSYKLLKFEYLNFPPIEYFEARNVWKVRLKTKTTWRKILGSFEFDIIVVPGMRAMSQLTEKPEYLVCL